MSASEKLVPLEGSQPKAQFVKHSLGRANANEWITVTVKIRSKNDPTADAAVQDAAPTAIRRIDFADRFGADPATLRRVEAYAKSHNLSVVESCAAKRRVVLGGHVADFEKAFGVSMERYAHDGGTFRSHAASVMVPESLKDEIEAVLGLCNRPAARPQFQRRRPGPLMARGLDAHDARPLSPLEVAQMYQFPSGLDGTGQCIAIIELGGGYKMDDLKTYFQYLKLPMPEVVEVSVLGATNTPGGDADGEVMLDIEVAGAVAPKARIVVYFAPNTDQGFITAIANAAHDTEHRPSVISISWGGPENSWRPSARVAMNNVIRDAALMGVTVTVAAGDNGSSDGVRDRRNHVDLPACCPFALACGGTRLEGTGASITSETVWNDGPDSAGGGGVSEVFPAPAYQSGVTIPHPRGHHRFVGRGVPDVAGNADPNSGYLVRVDGTDTVVGGTSAVAPLWAGLVALINQNRATPVGFLNPTLYQAAVAQEAFFDVTQGNNGAFSAGPGWDACTGLGSPNGARLLAALATPAPTSIPMPTTGN